MKNRKEKMRVKARLKCENKQNAKQAKNMHANTKESRFAPTILLTVLDYSSLFACSSFSCT
jgi:hypothetical protein